jgi:homoserine dehydrogenase
LVTQAHADEGADILFKLQEELGEIPDQLFDRVIDQVGVDLYDTTLGTSASVAMPRSSLAVAAGPRARPPMATRPMHMGASMQTSASCPREVLQMLPELTSKVRFTAKSAFSRNVAANAEPDAEYCEEKPVVAVLGYSGGVGTCLIEAMKRMGIEPYALVRSSTMDIGGAGPVPVDYKALGEALLAQAEKTGGQPVMADVTASSVPQAEYEGWLAKGISIAAANKGIFAGPEEKYEALLDAAAKEPTARLLHEATVGAGLPVISTLKDLKDSSHGITVVEGVVSGSLAYIMGMVAGGKKTLSDAVKEAKELGYTEPDPREDLSGMDVARKATILARVSGVKGIELAKLDVEALYPASLAEVSVEEFMKELPKYDADFAKRVADVEAKGQRLHYAAKVDAKSGSVEVGPLAVAADHPFNNAGLDNMVAITTNFYPRPLVVQGAGAGGDVTATGVLADILKCCTKPSVALTPGKGARN